MSVQVFQPFEIFYDINGKPLDDGFIWVGQPNLDPIANPISVFFDEALTIPAAQPIRTRNGFPANAGVQAQVFVAETTFSISINNKNSTVIRSVSAVHSSSDLEARLRDSVNPLNGATIVGRSSVSVTSISELSQLPTSNKILAELVLGGRSGEFYFDPSNLSSAVSADALKGIYIAPDSDSSGASGAWVRQYGQSDDYKPPVEAVWFYDNSGDITSALTSALAHGDLVNLPAGEFTISGAGVTIRSGKEVRGIKSSEVGTRHGTTGTRLKFGAGTTRFFYLDKAGDSTIDSVSIRGISFEGNNTAIAIQASDCRQCTFEALLFDNFVRCFQFDGPAWLNAFRDIKAFDFTRFVHFESGGEDSRFTQVIARSGRASSSGVFVNFFSQTMYFDNCDLSECTTHYFANIGLGNHTVIFNSCYFELSSVGTDAIIRASVSAGLTANVQINGCRFFDKSGGAVPDSTALKATGAGQVDFECNHSKFTSLLRLVRDDSGATIQTVSGKGNVLTGTAPTSFFSNVRNFSRQMGFIGSSNLENLRSIDKTYSVNHNFAAPFVIDFAGRSTTGIYQIDITGDGSPTGLAQIKYQPKSFFANGTVFEVTDKDAIFTQSVSADQLTIASSSSAIFQVVIRKIS